MKPMNPEQIAETLKAMGLDPADRITPDMTIGEEVAITLSRLAARDVIHPWHSETWGDWCRLHPLSEYRDEEWREWERQLLPKRLEAIAITPRMRALGYPWAGPHYANPVPTMKAVAAMPWWLKARWEGPWEARQGEEWRKAIGEPTREEESLAQAQADRYSHEVFQARFLDINWVQKNL